MNQEQTKAGFKKWPSVRGLRTRVAVPFSTAHQLLHDIHKRYERDRLGALDCLNYVTEDSMYDNWPARLAKYVQDRPPVQKREWVLPMEDHN